MKTADLVKDLEERLTGLGGNNYASCGEAIRGLVGEINSRNADIQQANAERDEHFMTAALEDERAFTQKADFDAEIDRITAANKAEMTKAAEEYDALSGETVDQVREVEQAKRSTANISNRRPPPPKRRSKRSPISTRFSGPKSNG